MADFYGTLTYLDDEGLHHPETHIFCDNEECTKALLDPNTSGLIGLNEAESNLITAIRWLIPTFQNHNLTHTHVYGGHQDDCTPVNELPFEAQTNIDFDTGTKYYMWASEIRSR